MFRLGAGVFKLKAEVFSTHKIMLFSCLICSSLTFIVCQESAHERRSSPGNLDTIKYISKTFIAQSAGALSQSTPHSLNSSSPSNGLWSASTGLMAGTNGTGVRLCNTTFILVHYSHLLSCPACSCRPCSGQRSRSRKP